MICAIGARPFYKRGGRTRQIRPGRARRGVRAAWIEAQAFGRPAGTAFAPRSGMAAPGNKDSTRPHEPEQIEKGLAERQPVHPGRTGATREGQGFGGPLAAGDASSGQEGAGARPNPMAQGLERADGIPPDAESPAQPTTPRRSGDRGGAPRADRD
jgi:hypothetical protein